MYLFNDTANTEIYTLSLHDALPIYRGIRTVLTLLSPDLLPEIVYTLEPRIAWWSVLLSLFISLGVGVLFGVYPARQAALMDPIEALRHE